MLRYWPAITLPPLVFLTLLSVAYALVPWACENQARAPLHVVSAVGLLLAALGVWAAWREWRALGFKRPDDKAEKTSWLRLLSVVGLMQASIFTLAIAVLWLTQFVIPPCVR